LLRLKLIRGDHHDVVRKSLLFVAVSWVPIALLAIGTARINPAANTFLRDLSLHVRLLIAIPLIFAAEDALDRLCNRAIATFDACRLARASDGSDPVPGVLRQAGRWRDAPAAEGLMLTVVFGFGIGVWKVTGQTGLLSEASAAMALPPAQAWYGFVALPLFNFLLLRALYRWAIWSGILLKLSRFELGTMPTHPDNAGGLEHLAEPTLGFAFLLTALSTVIASVWGTEVLYQGVSAKAYADEFALLVCLGEFLALSPLIAFSAGLVHTRLKGLRDYGRLALGYTRAFHQRWIESGNTDGLLGSADIQSLADLSNSYEVVKKMRIVPFGVRHALTLFAAIAAPMIPLILNEIGIHKLMQGVGQALLGGLSP
jgi:hypothetical protein